MPATTDITTYFVPPADAPAQPATLVAPDGRLQTGRFARPYDMGDLRHCMALHGQVRTAIGLPRLIEWYGCGMAHPEMYVAVIVVQAQAMSFTVVYGVDRRSGERFSHHLIGRSSCAVVSPSPWAGRTEFSSRRGHVHMAHDLAHARHTVTLELARHGPSPAVHGTVVWHEDLARSPALVALAPHNPWNRGHFVYNHKAQMPISGSLQIGERTLTYDPARDIANLDEVRSHLGLRNHYTWFNFGGIDPQGRIVGLNASDNQQRHPEWGCENAIWAGDNLTVLGPVRLDFNPRDLDAPWLGRDAAGRMDVTFTPQGGMELRLGPLGQYHQKCGVFNGTLRDGHGEIHTVRDYVGCVEYMAVL